MWPNDADGDALRRFQRDGFDFDKPVEIDFNIDVGSWPPPDLLVKLLRERFSSVHLIDPDEEDLASGYAVGYVLIQVVAELSYEFVVRMQQDLSELARPFGGSCESWGAMCK